MLRKGRFVLLGLAAAPYLLIAANGRQQAKPTFAADVLPVLKAHCASCHAGASAAASLDLTTQAGILKAVVTKSSKDSKLVQRLRGIGGAQMPMGFAPLPKDTIDKIAAWIDAGASVEAGGARHWSYVKPVKPKVPETGSSWVRNPVDEFVLARLKKEGLRPSPEASKERLLRRVYLDLIGLPPSPKEIDAFLADKQPGAYERVVDRLMNDPHYGERQAEPWLDLSRYADSDGYEKDSNRVAWKYRDWLIDAFNRNEHYDQFTTEQLAGDLLPSPSLDQLVATGFNRNTMFNKEGGVDQQEAHFNVVLDRVNTTATVWLGSTLQCARCHDHKYDPFTQRDFYRMAAFYADSVVLPQGPKSIGEEKWFESSIPVPSPQQEAEKRKLTAASRNLESALKVWTPELQTGFDKWAEQVKIGASWTVVKPEKLTSKNGAMLEADGTGVVTSSGKLPGIDDYTVSGKAGGNRISGVRIEAISSDSLPSRGPGRAGNGNFVISHVALVVGSKTYTFERAAADFDQRDNGALQALGSDPNHGWAVDGSEGKSHEIALELSKPITVSAETPVDVVIEQHWPGGQHLLGKFRVSFTADEHPAMLLLPPAIREMAKLPAGEVGLKDYFRKVTPLLDADRSQLAAVRMGLGKLEASIPTALVMRDKPHSGPLTAYMHSRGEFLSPTELVTAGFPAVLNGGTPKATTAGVSSILRIAEAGPSVATSQAPQLGSPVNGGTDPAPRPKITDDGVKRMSGPILTRLDLAKWLVSRENPMTARVEVNRLWEQFFGRGLVETSEDFGTQGARPSHPELLDWLACEFMDKGWDMKAMVRMIVTSATYRQASNASPLLMERDPQNILLARGPRFRLDAETIRDTSMAASGLLNPKLGGPSVYPAQPPGVWDTPYNGEQWMESKGPDRFRRGLYTFVKRSSPYPNFLDFDTTSREECTVRRVRTNTPLQALAMLNDQGVFEASRALGHRMVTEGGTLAGQRLTYGFRLCTGRKPSDAELTRLEALLQKLRTRIAQKPASAPKGSGSLEEAPWTLVGNVLLNLDEAVTKS